MANSDDGYAYSPAQKTSEAVASKARTGQSTIRIVKEAYCAARTSNYRESYPSQHGWVSALSSSPRGAILKSLDSYQLRIRED